MNTGMRTEFESPIVVLGGRLLSPYIMLIGLYVIFHGHYSPGGGFQGGALLAASILLMRLSGGRVTDLLQIKEKVTIPMASIGVLIYFGTGFIAILAGGFFLDYELLPFGMDPAYLRNTGILIIEIGIGVAVMAILIMIFDNMVRGEEL